MADLKRDPYYARFYAYSQVAFSNSARQAARMRYQTLTAGLEEVTAYVDKVNQTLADIKEGRRREWGYFDRFYTGCIRRLENQDPSTH